MAGVAGADRNKTADLTPAVAPPVDLGDAEAFEVIRRLLNAARAHGPASLGEGARLAQEPVRFRAAPGMRHASAEIAAFRPAAAPGAPAEMTVAFMGLTGPSGVLPDHYSDLVVQRRRARDPAITDFLDLFNHRSISLFYRAWAKYRLPVRHEEAAPLQDGFSRALAALIGLGLEAQRPRAGLAGGGLLGLAGPLGRKVRSPGALRRLVTSLFAFPAEVIEFHGRWIDIAPEERTRLAAPAPNRRSYAQLGVDAVAGVQTYDVQSRFRLRLGPMGLADFRAFFEPGGRRALVTQAVREAVGPAVSFDLQLVLRATDVPAVRLGDPASPAFLGQTTWLCSSPPTADRDDAVLAAA